MKTAGVREIKAHLSGYLREVAHGEVVLVTDRGRVVAELRPFAAADREASPMDSRYRQLVASEARGGPGFARLVVGRAYPTSRLYVAGSPRRGA